MGVRRARAILREDSGIPQKIGKIGIAESPSPCGDAALAPVCPVDREGFAEASALAIVTADDRGCITSWNAAAEQMFDIAREDAIGRSMEIIIPERFREAHRAGMRRVAGGAPSSLLGQTIEVMAIRGDGSEFPVALSLACWKSESGVDFGAYMLDISKRRTAEAKLEHRASHDQLTRLLSKSSFEARLAHAIASGRRMALVMIDLDGFKTVNDSLGHAVGDTLLQSLAVRLRAIAEPSWIIGRLGGDEFAIALETDAQSSEILLSARKLLQRISRAFHVSSHKLHISASLGIALSPDDATDVEELFALADRAMFQSKRRGGQKVRLFDQSMRAEIAARRSLNEGLREARDERQWEIYYQPQFDLAGDRLVGAEALLRWRHPEWGLIAPAAFLPVLDSHLAAFDVGQWVLAESCRQLSAWRAAGIAVPRVSCNLFAAQLHASSFHDDLSRILSTNGLLPEDVELEITEKIALKLDRESLRPLFELVKSGLGVALDDFGTGFASLTTLTRAPITQLKIDRSFVAHITEDRHSSAVVAGMVAMSNELQVGLIAEGVETAEQADRLRELGCHVMQGYKFGRPMNAQDFATLCETGLLRVPD